MVIGKLSLMTTSDVGGQKGHRKILQKWLRPIIPTVTSKSAFQTVSHTAYSVTHFSAAMVAVGSYRPDNKKSEIFKKGATNWTSIAEPPVWKSPFAHYATIFHAGNFYYFGGLVGKQPTKSILCLNEASWAWSKIGQLNSLRDRHGVILIGNTFMVIGGRNTKPNEVCHLKHDTFSCAELPSELKAYMMRPLCFLVNDDYGKC